MQPRDQHIEPPHHGTVDGLPCDVPSDALMTLLDGGRAVATVHDGLLQLHSLCRSRDGLRAAPLAHHRLPGPAVALCGYGAGIVVAVRHCDDTLLMRADDDGLLPLLTLAGPLRQLAVAGTHGYAVIDAGANTARLVRVHLRQRAITAETALAHADVTLALDASGDRLMVTDRRARRIETLTADLRPLRAQPASRDTEIHVTGKRHPSGCCCHACSPCGGGPEHEADEPGERDGKPGHDAPGHDDPGRDPSGRDPGHEGVPGDAGLPGENGTSIVGEGGRVEKRPPGGRGRPCGLTLFHAVTELRRIGSYILASDRGHRTASLLSSDMNLLEQWNFGRGGARLLSAPDAPLLLTYRHDSRTWTWQDVHLSVVRRRPDLSVFPLQPLETKTFIGQQVYALSHGQQPSPTEIKALLIPIVEGDQAFTSTDLSGFGAFMRRTMLPVVRDYYDENSFGILQNVSVDVFGADAGPLAGPIVLPRGKLADYYWPAYVAAQLQCVRSGVTAADSIVMDGRETLTVNAKPRDGGLAGGPISLPFFALGLRKGFDLFPVGIKFLGTEKLVLNVTPPGGAATTLSLNFPAKTFSIPDEASIAPRLAELVTYLDGVMAAAETAAGIASRLFAAPAAVRIPAAGMQFGELALTFKATATTGDKLRVTGASSTTPGGDPLALADAIVGTIPVWNTGDLSAYLGLSALLGQETAGFAYNNRMLNPPAAAFDGTAKTLTTTIPISDRHGGIGATVTLVSSSGLDSLFSTSSAVPNSATDQNNAQALRDRGDLYRDVFSAAVARLRAAGLRTDLLNAYGAVLILPVEPSAPNPADPDAVLPVETWKVTALHRPIDFRGAEDVTTVIDRVDEKTQLQSAWALIFMSGGKPDNPMIIHELGHAIGYGDLYFQTGYRDELAYFDSWAMMCWHPPLSHHCGYHKLQSGWIPDGAGTEQDYGRVLPIGLPQPDATRSWDFLLVPLELWRDSLVASARSAFGAGDDMPVVQLAWIDLGGDGATFGLVEARQKGHHFSRSLPLPDGGVLLSNGIAWTLDERFAVNNFYRRPLHLLNPNNILYNPGDEFDLAHAPELPMKGVKVRVTDRKVVEGDATVYRITLTRENAEFVDLFFESPETYWKNPDLWVDWAGNNTPDAETVTPDYPVGQPTDQGEAIRVHPSRPEQHWMVARLRNRGQVPAKDVKLNFYYFDPPGGGDGGKPMNVKDLSHYRLVGSTTVPEVQGASVPVKAKVRWDVPPGFGGHTCLLVQIEDYRIPEDATGGALGSEDVWQVNNHAQKNVDKYEALSASPFAPIDFEFSVRNEGITPEVAYLEPDALPYGMKLSVTPPLQTIAAQSIAIFRCRLELDTEIIRTGCENDQRFRIHAWRRDAESTARWGGVEYEVRPREKTATTLSGTWDYGNTVVLNGQVTPNPGGGQVKVRIDFDGHQPRWETVTLTTAGTFTWSGPAPAGSFALEGVAWFEGNRKFGSSRSGPATLKPPPIIH